MKIKWINKFCFILLFVCTFHKITELIQDNFEKYMNQTEIFIIEFYSLQCPPCKNFHFEFEKFENLIEKNNSNICLSRMDGKLYTNISRRYNIKQYPAILLFVKNRIPVEFFGEKVASKLLEFVESKLNFDLDFLPESKDIKFTKEQNDVLVVYGGDKNETDYSVLKGVAWLYDKIKFFHSPIIELEKESREKAKLVLFKKYDEPITYYKYQFSLEKIKSFLDSNYLPIVIPFSNKYSDDIFFKLKRSVFLFIELDSERSKKIQQIFYEFAKANRGKFMFFITNLESTLVEANLKEFLRIKSESFPRIEIIDPDEVLSRYLYTQNEISFEGLTMFIEQFHSGNLKRFLKSEDPPEYYHDAVQKIVGLTWQDKVINNKKDVVIKFHIPWCSYCPTFAPIFSHMAELLAINKNLVFGEIDITENDLIGIHFEEYPAIMLYPAKDKEHPIQYNGNKTIDDIISFLQDKSSVPLNLSKYEKWNRWIKNGEL